MTYTPPLRLRDAFAKDGSTHGGHVVVVGAGFTGLSAGWELSRHGYKVTVLESDELIGGLAGGFKVSGTILEKFYHHWFNNDEHITELVKELGLTKNLLPHQSRTGMYYAKSLFRLSKPLDLLRFTPLPLWDRFRLGVLVPQARAVRDWRTLESLTAKEWILQLCGANVYRVVWEPLLRGKFGDVADEISAVWLWNKLCLRGGSRDRKGNEVLLYYRGGFPALADALRQRIESNGGFVRTSTPALALERDGQQITGVVTPSGTIPCDDVVISTPLPVAADLLTPHVNAASADALRRIKYLSNICLVLELDRSLTDLYWINVNDPSFPFVGIIEHTNFEPPETYGGNHVVYLSRYLPAADPTYALSSDDYLAFCMPYIKQMFPQFDASWIRRHNVWRADYAQPIVERNYSSLLRNVDSSFANVFLSTMAQIYPEDRGTNYAVRSGREIAQCVMSKSKTHKGDR